MARTLDIYCKVCNSKAVVQRTEKIHSDFNKLYCYCRNPNCRHKFVMNLEFSHTTSSSLLTKDQILFSALENQFRQLSEDDKNRIRKMLD